MADYIDREQAIEAAYQGLKRPNEDPKWIDICENLKAVPSADVKPVMSCAECVHWNAETHGCTRNPSLAPWWESDFCNYWEKGADK